MKSMKRMTAQPVRPGRYRPGKALPEAPSSSEGSDSEDDARQAETIQKPAAPKIAGLSGAGTVISRTLKDVDLDARKLEAQRKEAIRLEQARRVVQSFEDGFVTDESEIEQAASEEDSQDETEASDESGSSEEDVRRAVRPTFIRKDQRHGSESKTAAVESKLDPDREYEAEQARRKQEADEMLREQLRKDAEARAADMRGWDDPDDGNLEEVDDTDGIDPEAEYAAWRLRELKRMQRDREAIQEAENERAEVERRKGLSREERETEDKQHLQRQQAEKDSRGTMSFMQKYHHKGAFFQTEEQMAEVGRRDLMGSRFQDEGSRDLLPEYMQVRDATKLGRKGRTKYKDMRAEDTGRWGELAGPRRGEKRDRGGLSGGGLGAGGEGGRDTGTVDARFLPDFDQDHRRERSEKRPRYT